MIRLIVISRPPSSSPLTTFDDEFSVLRGELAIASGELPIVGDFNIHVNCSSDSSATHFRDLLASFDLKWVTTPTHASEHTLDLIITRNQCRVLGDIRVVDPLICDHCPIFTSLLLHKPQLQRKTIRYRKLRSIDYEELQNAVKPLIYRFS